MEKPSFQRVPVYRGLQEVLNNVDLPAKVTIFPFTEALKAFQPIPFKGNCVSACLIAAQCALTLPVIKGKPISPLMGIPCFYRVMGSHAVTKSL
jgi:hypothetical protein